MRSVALGLWVRTGSRDEGPGEEGVSHFLEHLLFKGTERYSAIEISELFDGMGAAANAATSKESTHVHARFLDEHTDEAFDLMAEMMLGPTFPEVDSEREVVLEEIAMYEDEPADRVHDFLAEALYGDHPLGKRVLGRADVISSIPVPKIAEYHRGRYVAGNLVVAGAGHLEHDHIVELASKLVQPPPGNVAPPNGGDTQRAPRLRFNEKDTEQYHICFGAPGISRADERRFALAVVDSAFGGSVSSRLFREVREKRGLAYAVGSYSEQYLDRGSVAMYVGTREENVAEACEIIGRELGKLGTDEGIGGDELTRAKEHVKGRMVLGMESTAARMSRLSRSILFDLPLLSLDEMLARVDGVDESDVAELAAELFDPARFSAACIGKDENCFRTAAASVSEELVAA